MEPSTSTRSSSRRSSILKPPKPRHPLHNLNLANSFDENNCSMTTTKLKRRVSFAEKKHVKEFCNSLEQGTVWDDTYEEHDLSNMKALHTSNEKQCENVDICKENIHINEFATSEAVDECSVQGDNMQYTIEENNSIPVTNFQLSNNYISVYEDSDENLPNNCQNLNATSVQTVNMEFTEVICNVMHVGTENIPQNKLQDTDKDISIELTQPVLSCINILKNVNNFQQQQRTEKCNLKYKETVMKECDRDISMELTVPIPTITLSEPISNADNANEKTERFNNVSMELTTIIPSTSFNLQQMNINHMENSNSSSVIQNSKKVTIAFNDELMDITKPIKTNTSKDGICQDVATDNCNGLTLMEKVPQYKYNTTCIDERTMEITKTIPQLYDTTCINQRTMEINEAVPRLNDITCIDARTMEITKAVPRLYDTTCIDERTMEITKAVPLNIHSSSRNQEINPNVKTVNSNFETSKSNINYYKTAVNFDKTVCDDVEMEFTTAITTLSKAYLDNSRSSESAQNNSIQLDTNIVSNNTIFYNNSITATAVASTLNVKDTCEEETENCEVNTDKQELTGIVSDPNISMEITEAVLPLQSQSEEENLINDDILNKSGLPENVENTDLPKNSSNESTVLDNVIKDTIAISFANSNVSLNKKTYVIENTTNLKDSFSKEHVPDEVQNSASIKTSMALHDPVEQDTYALALKEDNTGTAFASPNPALNNHACVVTSELNKSNCLQQEHSQNIKLHPRRTYTIKRLNTNDSDTNSNKEMCKILKVNNDNFCYEINNKENCAYTVLSDVGNLQEEEDNDEQPSLVPSILLNECSEELESIKPPSFISLDDSLYEDTSVNALYNQELNNETSCTAETEKNSENIKCKNAPTNNENFNIIQDNQVDMSKEEDSKLQMSFGENIHCNREVDSSGPKFEDQIQISEIKKLQLPRVNSINTDIQILEYSSSTIINTQQYSASNVEKDYEDVEMQDTHADKENSHNMEYPLPTVEHFVEQVSTPSNSNSLLSQDKTNEDVEIQDIHADNLQNQNMVCSLLKKSHIDTKTSTHKSDNNYLCNDELKCVDQDMSNAELKTLDPCISSVENDISVELDPFSLLVKELRACAESDEVIWNVYYENIERKLFIIGFISCSLLVVIYLKNYDDTENTQFIENIRIISRLVDGADALISIVHKVILEKLDVKRMLDSYESSEDIFPMLDFISKEVKLAMDFMFELKRLDDINLMDITRDSISFVSRTKRMDIILRITVIVKPFDMIETHDVSVQCLLGSVRENDIKKLIINIKKDHKFLRRFISDVRDYIYLMEESSNVIHKPCLL